MSTKTPIFLTGATGYIGGSVLVRLLNQPSAGTYDITVLVRNEEKGRLLESRFAVKAVIGTHQEFDKVASLAENAHVVFNLANADDLDLTKAILSGMRKRHAKLGDLPILIHTSGTATLNDDARGEHAVDTVFDDFNVEQLKSISDSAEHRTIDLHIMEADKLGYLRAYLILPSTIYGSATHELVDAGVSNGMSIQIPVLIKAALARKRAGVVGKGAALWPNVHIDDIAELYMVLFDAIVRSPDSTGHGWEGFYFGESGEHSWYQISKTIGDALVQLGIAAEAEPTSFSTEELVKYFGSEQVGLSFGANSRCRGNRSRSVGWKPQHTAEDMFKHIPQEAKVLAGEHK